MTGNLEGLELRKALCEALGWRIKKTERMYAGTRGGWVETLSPEGKSVNMSTSMDGAASRLPALESDPGVFWPEFEKWAMEERASWCIEAVVDYTRVFYLILGRRAPEHSVEGRCAYSEPVILAGCRAWLAALEQLRRA